MPMNMGNHISEAGKVDLVGLEKGADRFFNGENNRHQQLTLCEWKITHFANMRIQNDPTKAWVVGVVYPDDTPCRGLHKDNAARR